MVELLRFNQGVKQNQTLNFNFEKIELYLPIRFAITIFIIIQIQYIAFYLKYHIRHHQHYFFYHHEVAFFFDKHLLVEGQNTSFNRSYFSFQKAIIWKRVLILFVLTAYLCKKIFKKITTCFKKLLLNA